MYSGTLRQERDRLIERERQRCRERQRTEGDRAREKEFELTCFCCLKSMTNMNLLLSLLWQTYFLQTLRMKILKRHSVQFSSVAQSCPTLCDPMNCSLTDIYFFKWIWWHVAWYMRKKSTILGRQTLHCDPFSSPLLCPEKFSVG